MNVNALITAGRISILQKRAAASDHSENCDAKLEEESKKLNEGGSPASAGNNASNAATFDTPAHAKKPSGTGPSNTVPDNEDTTPRQKVASLDELLNKAAATQVAATKSALLETEADKEVVGGGNGNEVQSACLSEKAPDIKLSSNKGGGDVNSDSVARSGSMDKAASMNAGGILHVLKKSVGSLYR
jgi:hypothetical protein